MVPGRLSRYGPEAHAPLASALANSSDGPPRTAHIFAESRTEFTEEVSDLFPSP